MRHPTDGTLRRLLDEPDAIADDVRSHAARCPVCTDGLARARADAATAAAALEPGTDPAPDVDAAWARFAAHHPVARTRAVAPPPARRWRRTIGRPVAAVAAALVVLAGAGVAAAADWLPIFHTEHVTTVPVATTDLVQLPDLSQYGDFTVTGQQSAHQVADAAAARAATGLAVPAVRNLPAGVSGDPVYEVAGPVTATFTFSAQKAAQAAAAAGQQPPAPPPGLDGSRLRITAGPGVAVVWPRSSQLPELLVARLTAPTVESSGVPYDTVRDYLLSLPGLPPDLAAQLRAISADATTLPLPVPANLATSSPTRVDGVAATLLTARTGTMAAVVWVKDGVVSGVAGMLPADQILAVARSLS